MLSCAIGVTEWECLTEHHTDVELCDWCHRMTQEVSQKVSTAVSQGSKSYQAWNDNSVELAAAAKVWSFAVVLGGFWGFHVFWCF